MKNFSKSLRYSVAELEPESEAAYFQGQKKMVIKTAEALKVGKSGFKPWFCIFQLWDGVGKLCNLLYLVPWYFSSIK